MKQKIYISGKITGMEEEAEKLFKFHAKIIESKGFEPVNPMELNHNHDKSWLAFMREDLKALCDCDGVFFMENWFESPGAVIEHNLAHALKLRVYYEVTPKHLL